MSGLKRGEKVEITTGPPEVVGHIGAVEEVFADNTASVWVPDFFTNIRLPKAGLERMSDKSWPFGLDADEHDPLTAHRIPVTSDYPRFGFVIAFDRESAARPTDAEIRMLVSYLNEIKIRYNCYPDDRPLDADGGANTVIFHKHGENDWSYRRRSWQHGFMPIHWKEWTGEKFAPTGRLTWYDGSETFKHSLEQIMDRAHGWNDSKAEGGFYIPRSWVTWKAEHPEAFPLTVTA